MGRPKYDKAALISKLQQLEGLTNEEKSSLMALLNEDKTYGLVWEDSPEEVEENLRSHIPVLHEVTERALTDGGADAPNHILIEGDNLDALTALSYTHEGKIDVIYIDPPYNTGNEDFVYNDKYVNTEDSYRHSKWLSFMSRRLYIAKRLLSDKGVIFISIDDNEQANLKLLCDEVFGSNAFVASAARRRRKSQANLSKNISTIHEYVLIYKKKEEHELNKVEASIDLSEYKNPDNDPRGSYKTMPCTNRGGTKYSVITPSGRIVHDEWRFKEETFYSLLNDNRIVFPKGGEGKPRYKLFLSEKEKGGVIDNTWWEDLGSNQEGATLLEDIVGKDVFNNPKPIGLINHILKLNTDESSIILDFFAGSGTTLHATMQLNAEDGGHRQCILVTNNENNICEGVTYERNKRVIQGYTTPKGVAVEGLHNNSLRYYCTEFIPRERTQRNMRALVNAATDLLCIKEDLYQELPIASWRLPVRLTSKQVRLFSDGTKSMMVIYNEQTIPYLVEGILKITSKNTEETKNENGFGFFDVKNKIKVYVFSPGRYAFDDDFYEVRDKVELVALPAAIYDAYQRVLPRQKERLLDEAEQPTPKTWASAMTIDFEEGGEQ